MKISAKSATGYDPDNFIGVAPNATDSLDGYKYGKPPIMNKGLSLDIIHKDWEKDGRYAHDLRSPALYDQNVGYGRHLGQTGRERDAVVGEHRP